MVRPDGMVKVLDFGLARLVRPLAFASHEATATQTGAGSILGTVSYMSPEQARGEVADARSDLWRLGVVLYEMLAGRRPFDAGSQTEILTAITTSEPVPLRSINRSVPSALERAISRLLAKPPHDRPASSAAVAQEATVLVLLVCVSVGAWLAYRWSNRQWARYDAPTSR